jgi:hypothetical protein
MIRTSKEKRTSGARKRATGADGLVEDGIQDPHIKERAGGRGEGERAHLRHANGPIMPYGAPPAMKADKLDPHTRPAPALARRAHIGEEKGRKSEDGATDQRTR